MEKNNKKLIVVLGMHRCGTSAITRALETLGVPLGDNLIQGAAGDNDKGFFEDQEVVLFNENELLKALGLTWQSLNFISSEKFDLPDVCALQDRAAELLERKFSATALLGLKDPRMCILLPFWQRIFDRMELHVTYVMAIRNPMSVAASLQKRDGIYPIKSYMILFLYELAAVIGTHGKPRVFVDYDKLMSDTVTQLHRMARQTGLSVENVPEKSIREYKCNYLATELRHAQYSAEDVENNQQIIAPIKQALQLLELASRDEMLPSDSGFVMKWIHLRDEIVTSPMFDYLIESDRQIIERETKIASLKNDVAERGLLIHQIYSSRSWRLTRPLRFLAKHLRKARRLHNE